MKYTNEQLIKIEEKAKKNKKLLTHITNKAKLSTEDRFKLGLCRHFVQYLVMKKLKLKQLAKLIDIPVTRLSEITNYKINKFKVDQLLKNLSILGEHDAEIKEYLIFLNQAVDLPALPVAATKRLTRDIKEAALQV